MQIRRTHLLLLAVLVASASSVHAEGSTVELQRRHHRTMEKRVKRGDDLARRLFGTGGQSSSSDDSNSGSGSSNSGSTTGNGSNGNSGSGTTSSSNTQTSSKTASSTTDGGLLGGLFPTSSADTSSSLASVSQAASSSAAAAAASSASAAAASSASAASAAASRSSAAEASRSSALLATSTDSAGMTTVITSFVSAATDTAASASSTASSEDESSGNHTPLIIGVSVVGGVALIGGIAFLIAKFWGKRSGFDDSDADIKWPELKHGDDDGAAMQPLPARRTGGAGFDMGDEGSDIGHGAGAAHMANVGPAPDYSPPLGADSHSMMSADAYGAKLSHHDSYAASTTQLTGPGGAPYVSGQEYHGYYDHYGGAPPQQQPGVNYGQSFSDHDGGAIAPQGGSEYAHAGADGYGHGGADGYVDHGAAGHHYDAYGNGGGAYR